MRAKIPFRFLLPFVQTVSAALFGGVGLWQRHQILSRPLWGDQTLWESTARFHVWPLPFKFAAVTNIPALLVTGFAEWPVERIWPNIPEAIELVPSLVFVALLWYWLGSRLDARRTFSRRKSWIILVVFTALCLVGTFTPGHVGYIPFGIVLWVAFLAVVVRTSKRTDAQNSVLTDLSRAR